MRVLFTAIAASFLLGGCSGSSDGGDGGAPVCGDGIVSAPEVCDGAALGGSDCTTVPGGFVRGTLACAADCLGFVTAGCAGPACGDGIVSAPEVCDGENLGGKDCTTIPGGYVGGTLACAAGCLEFADARCVLPPGPTCTIPGALCLRFTAAQGLSQIEAQCARFAATWAAEGTCSLDGAFRGYCLLPDLSSLQLSIPGATARAYFYAGAAASPAAAVSTCKSLGGTWAGVGAWTCGDGAITGLEVCDGTNVGGATCTSLGAASGTLRCAADCLTLDLGGCSTVLSCLRAAAGMCQQAAIPGIPPPGSVASFESSCTGTDPPGTYAAAPCPTASRLGYCDSGDGNWMVFYPPADSTLATFLCSLARGTWVSP